MAAPTITLTIPQYEALKLKELLPIAQYPHTVLELHHKLNRCTCSRPGHAYHLPECALANQAV